MTAPDAVASLLMAEIGRERPGSFFAPRPVRKHMISDGTPEATDATVNRGSACSTNPIALPE